MIQYGNTLMGSRILSLRSIFSESRNTLIYTFESRTQDKKIYSILKRTQTKGKKGFLKRVTLSVLFIPKNGWDKCSTSLAKYLTFSTRCSLCNNKQRVTNDKKGGLLSLEFLLFIKQMKLRIKHIQLDSKTLIIFLLRLKHRKSQNKSRVFTLRKLRIFI